VFLSHVPGTIAEGAPIIPISAQLRFNIDAVLENMVKRIPVPLRDFTSSPRLIVIRSFDVNRPGCEIDDLLGGVAGVFPSCLLLLYLCLCLPVLFAFHIILFVSRRVVSLCVLLIISVFDLALLFLSHVSRRQYHVWRAESRRSH
jgi:hypothetical protein